MEGSTAVSYFSASTSQYHWPVSQCDRVRQFTCMTKRQHQVIRQPMPHPVGLRRHIRPKSLRQQPTGHREMRLSILRFMTTPTKQLPNRHWPALFGNVHLLVQLLNRLLALVQVLVQPIVVVTDIEIEMMMMMVIPVTCNK